MGSFRQGRPSFGGPSRGGGFSRGGDRGGRGGFGGRPRSFGGDRDNRGPAEMHDATCSKCGKACQVPFRPTGSKPVFCSDCFRQTEGGRDNGRDFAPRSQSNSASSGISQEQFKQINVKLDKILSVLQELEIDVEEGLEDEEDSEEDEEKTDN